MICASVYLLVFNRILLMHLAETILLLMPLKFGGDYPGKAGSARIQEQRMPAMRRQPERLVFIDETSVKTNLTRLRRRALRSQRLRMDAPFGRWGTQTFIAGLTSRGLIAPWVIKGAMDGDAFAAYIRDVLVAELKPGTVVIMDNLATHRKVEAAKAIRAAKCWFLYAFATAMLKFGPFSSCVSTQ